MKNSRILLRALLLSTSQRNIYRYTTDKKKRNKIVGNFIGTMCIYAMLMSYSIANSIGFGKLGMADAIPVMCALVISLLAFILTVFKTNGYLFNFKEYDMLMALPFEPRTVAACKFLYMYIKSLPWYLSISLAMMIGYGYYVRPNILAYPVWIILTLCLPVIPMLGSAFLGYLIAKISAGFRKSNLIQTVLTMVFVIFCFSLRFIIDDVFQNDKVEETLEKTNEITGNMAKRYLPAGWFGHAVTGQGILDGLLLMGVSAALFIVVFRIVGKSYRKINSALASHAASRGFQMTRQKKRSAVRSIAFKEYKRMMGSTVYMVNIGIGMILSSLFGIVTLVIGFDKMIGIVTKNAPFDPAILQPAIPFIIYFFIGMVASTACSPSLEGKNYWILKSLPLTKKTIYQGKMLFNLYITVPFMVFSELCLCISAKVPFVNTVLYLILGILLCAFSTTWGCVCGVKHMRLDWENEIEVVKQGAAVAIYMLPNMFVVMGLWVLVVFLGMHMDHRLLTLIWIVITSVLTLLSYLRVIALAAEPKGKDAR